jgi:transposase
MRCLRLIPSLVHLDSSSFHVDGTYNSKVEPEPGVIQITLSYSRDYHPHLNQVVLNLIEEHQVTGTHSLMIKADNGNQIDSQA